MGILKITSAFTYRNVLTHSKNCCMLMKKTVLFSIALTLSTLATFGQNVFIGSSLSVGRIFSTPYIRQGAPLPELISSQAETFVAFSASVDAQVIPVGDEMTVGFHIEPSAGVSLAGGGFRNGDPRFILQSPLLAQFNYGNFSSIDAFSSLGVSFGLGLLSHYQLVPDKPVYLAEGKNLLFLPMAQLSFRFWGPANTLYSLKVSHSFGSEDLGGISHNRSVSFLSLSRSFNY